MRTPSKSSIAALQSMVSALGATAVKIDGLIGPQTAYAMSRLNEVSRTLVEGFIKLAGIDMPTLVSLSELRALANDVGRETKVEPGVLMFIVEHENAIVNGHIYVEVEVPYVGIGQFDEPTWESVSTLDYSAAKEIVPSMYAIANLYHANAKSYLVKRKKNVPFTKEIAYLYHNQGAGSAYKYLATGEIVHPKQSAKAIKTMKTAGEQYVTSKSISHRAFA